MATAPLATVLRHIRQIAVSERIRGLTDAELLNRFGTGRDQAAFAALVQRHGPLVWDVCRHQLGHEQDAEDAFQAVFLILARSVQAIRNAAVLASWLYGVAYRTAMKAKRLAAIRRTHERRRANLPRATAHSQAELGELLAVLHEEVQRMPESYRAPFVLCCLQGLSRAEAAKELGWKEGTVAGRLGRARSRLRRRLTRRGISLGSMLGAVAVSQNVGRATLPAGLVDRTVNLALLLAADQAAAASSVSAPIATLLRGASASGTFARFKNAVLSLLALGVALTGAGILARPSSEHPEFAPQSQSKPAQPSASALVAGEPAPASMVSVTGHVSGPDGKPFAGAQLYLAYYNLAEKVLPRRATSGADGRFSFAYAPGESALFGVEQPAQIVAVARGYGLAWSDLGKPGKSADLSLRLSKDEVPIRGRVVDTEGQPVQGAKVSLVAVHAFPGEDLTSYLQAVAGRKQPPRPRHLLLTNAQIPGLTAGVTTDGQGRFQLAGLGQERIVGLGIEGTAIQHGTIQIMTRKTRAIKAKAAPYQEQAEIYGSTFDHVALPGRTVTGIVKDKSTGQPLARVSVRGAQTNAKVFTDQGGRYVLPGFPKAKAYTLYAFPAAGHPNFLASLNVADTPGLDPIRADIELEHGIPLTVRVTDKATGGPLTRDLTIYYMPLFPNPNHHPAAGFSGINSVDPRPDGSFTGVVCPGPGAIGVRANTGSYMPACVNPREFFPEGRDPARKGQQMFGDKDTLLVSSPPGVLPQPLPQSQFHAIVLINPAADSRDVMQQIALDPGRTLTATVLGTDGKPLPGVRIWGTKPAFGWEAAQTASLTVTGLNPERPRTLLFRHEDKHLAGAVTVRGDEQEAVTVQLQPWGTVTGRLVDAKGLPRPDVPLQSGNGKPGDPLTLFVADPIKTDRDGRFRINGLVPGRKYHFHVQGYEPRIETFIEGKAISDLTVQAGETRDLGAIRSRPYR